MIIIGPILVIVPAPGTPGRIVILVILVILVLVFSPSFSSFIHKERNVDPTVFHTAPIRTAMAIFSATDLRPKLGLQVYYESSSIAEFIVLDPQPEWTIVSFCEILKCRFCQHFHTFLSDPVVA